jgi:hypothetical protein
LNCSCLFQKQTFASENVTMKRKSKTAGGRAAALRYRGTILSVNRKHNPNLYHYDCIIVFSDLVEIKTGKSPRTPSVSLVIDDSDEIDDDLKPGATMEFSAHPSPRRGLLGVTGISLRQKQDGLASPESSAVASTPDKVAQAKERLQQIAVEEAAAAPPAQ